MLEVGYVPTTTMMIIAIGHRYFAVVQKPWKKPSIIHPFLMKAPILGIEPRSSV
jgi:hypothetical protein